MPFGCMNEQSGFGEFWVFRLSSCISHVTKKTSDEQVVKYWYKENNLGSHWYLRVSRTSLQLSTMLALTSLDAGDASYLRVSRINRSCA